MDLDQLRDWISAILVFIPILFAFTIIDKVFKKLSNYILKKIGAVLKKLWSNRTPAQSTFNERQPSSPPVPQDHQTANESSNPIGNRPIPQPSQAQPAASTSSAPSPVNITAKASSTAAPYALSDRPKIPTATPKPPNKKNTLKTWIIGQMIFDRPTFKDNHRFL